MSAYPPAPARRGSLFTLIEATVVITILALLAALVMPNTVALQRSREVQSLKSSILRLPAEAQNEARKSQQAITLRAEGSSTLVLERVGTDSTDITEFKRLSLGKEIQLDAAQLEGESTDLASWEWTVYPDGSARVGRLEFAEGNQILSLSLPGAGELPRWSSTTAIEPGEERWSAGELQQRG